MIICIIFFSIAGFIAGWYRGRVYELRNSINDLEEMNRRLDDVSNMVQSPPSKRSKEGGH